MDERHRLHGRAGTDQNALALSPARETPMRIAARRERFLPEGWHFERGTLETGDIALAVLPDGAVAERKTPSDMVSCIGSERERFERELKRGRYCGRMILATENGYDLLGSQA
jgi:hypothetical protein